jgi:hypothetical protein
VTVHAEFRRLDIWEEACGFLEVLEEIDGLLIAKIGNVRIVLPLRLELDLKPLISKRIAVLHTDVPEKQYLYRILAEDPNSLGAN